MSLIQTYTRQYRCDGCAMVVDDSEGVPAGWLEWKPTEYDMMALHACLKCNLSDLVTEYLRRRTRSSP